MDKLVWISKDFAEAMSWFWIMLEVVLPVIRFTTAFK